jgi:Amt family ammonium transporter
MPLLRPLLLVGATVLGLSAAEAEAALVPAKPAIDSGSTAWVMVSAGWVLFMTIPGLALFYGGLVRSKNVLSILAQCFAITALITLLWVAYGYSLCFSQAGMQAGVLNLHSVIGGLDKAFFSGVTADSVHPLAPTIPETVFAVFQLTFAIITPALLVGAFAERMKFIAVLWIAALWFTLVYAPICHMAWAGDGALFGSHWGLLDLAGGTVVEINSGIAGLVACLVAGSRQGYKTEPIKPHNVAMCFTGGAMLWVGWFGFNAGSAVAANGQAGMALLNTQIAAAAAAAGWALVEWFKYGKASALGMVTGAVGGLVAITPACGFVGPAGALALGGIAGMVCWLFVMVVKNRLGYDDSLDVFGVHGVAGLIGTFGTGIFCAKALGGSKDGMQILGQVQSIAVTVAWSAIGTYVVMKVVDLTIGLRAHERHETEGLDLSAHGEAAYNHE